MRKATSARRVRYQFAPDEMRELGKRLAEASLKVSALDAERQRVVADLKAQLTSAQSEIGSLSEKIASGYELREVVCEIAYHMPANGKKTVTRPDTGEVVAVEDMTPDELQEPLPLNDGGEDGTP